MKKTALIAIALAFALAAAAPVSSRPRPPPALRLPPSRASTRPSSHASTRPALPAPDAKVVQAVRATEPIVLDGRLDESVWKTAPARPASPRTTPRTAPPPREPTEVWVAYDDHALYVAAFCHDSDPSKILKRLGRRDSQTDSDWFMVAVDPYFDKRSGYAFYANPAGSITDAALSNDVNDDDSWDGVWENKAAVNERGLDGRDAHPLQPDPLPQEGRVRLGRQFPPHASGARTSNRPSTGPRRAKRRSCRGSPGSRESAASARAATSSSCPTPSARPSSGPPRAAIPSRRAIALSATSASTSRSA